MLTREQLVTHKTKEITIDGGSVVIRALTAGEAFDLRGKKIGRVEIFEIIALSLVDPQVLPTDVANMSTATVTQLTTEIFAFNALGSKAVEDAKAELKKTDDLIMNSAGHWEPPQSK